MNRDFDQVERKSQNRVSWKLLFAILYSIRCNRLIYLLLLSIFRQSEIFVKFCQTKRKQLKYLLNFLFCSLECQFHSSRFNCKRGLKIFKILFLLDNTFLVNIRTQNVNCFCFCIQITNFFCKSIVVVHTVYVFSSGKNISSTCSFLLSHLFHHSSIYSFVHCFIT